MIYFKILLIFYSYSTEIYKRLSRTKSWGSAADRVPMNTVKLMLTVGKLDMYRAKIKVMYVVIVIAAPAASKS